jgi:uncharacterized protein YecE (DUF72 family)
MIRVGPAGWSYRDWEGIVYPRPRPRGFQSLALIARMFDLAEVNVTFYRPPRRQVAEAWCDLLDRLGAERFRFTVKLWQGLTHGDGAADAGEAVRLRETCDLLRGRGRLLGVLAQFPWSFKSTSVSRDRLARLADAWADLGLAVEVRHGSWEDEGYLEWLRERGVAFVNIDQPVIGKSLGPSAHVTSTELAYIRLHGRNHEAWFSDRADSAERYNYHYSSQELGPWVARAARISTAAVETAFITNNHFRGQAVSNALELQAALCPGREVPVPRGLIETIPTLREVPGLREAEGDEFVVADEQEETGQLDLF